MAPQGPLDLTPTFTAKGRTFRKPGATLFAMVSFFNPLGINKIFNIPLLSKIGIVSNPTVKSYSSPRRIDS